MDALSRAQEVRLGRAKVKAGLKAGKVSFEDALTLEVCQSARVHDLLMAVPGVGQVKATRLMNVSRLGLGRRVALLTVRERAALLSELEQ
jgi:hypothetical protein